MSVQRKRSVTLHGHRTSFSLEEEFFQEIQRIARERDQAVAALIAEVDDSRPRDINLSSALRLFVLDYLKARLTGR